jgi:hypothetical protein
MSKHIIKYHINKNINKISTMNINNPINTSSNIYIIGGVTGGGSLKFINDFIQQFPDTIHIKTYNILKNISFLQSDILLIQQLFDDIKPSMLIDIKNKYNCRLILNIHDFTWIKSSNSASAYLLKNIKIPDPIINLFKTCETVIHPSQFTYDEYSKYFCSDNFIISPHIDFKDLNSELNIPLIENKTINIGILHEFNEYKGSETISYLMNMIENYNEYKINFYIVGKNIKIYDENEFFEYLDKYKIHCLTLLNKWGETYCYSLSKYLKSGLPIIYNSIGAVKDRMPNKEYYFKVFESEDDINTKNLILFSEFSKMIEYIILHQGKNNDTKKNTDVTVEIPPLYNNIFNNIKISRLENNKYIKHKIKVYCIYFPQFHKINENDINFYDGYSDIINLDLFIKETKTDQETPSTKLLPIKNNIDYDLEQNTELVQRQIELIKEYNISGFAIYYYWFSINTITNKNMIMENVINKFFSDDIKMYDKKVYFVWANESWSNNLSFGKSNKNRIIKNEYNIIEFIKNIDNLLVYFKHVNYLKIDNKPVFFIHHPWFIPNPELDLFKILINKKCIENNFNGCNLVINSMNGVYENYKHYDFHLNYKDSTHYKIVNNQRVLNYQDYTDTIINDNSSIKTLVFNFDNRARLYKPDRLANSTITINNTEEEQLKFINNIYNSYGNSYSEIDNILLINSWNEWGEQMAIEPSNEKGTYYLDLLKNILSKKN